jgi:hypothetical protein
VSGDHGTAMRAFLTASARPGGEGRKGKPLYNHGISPLFATYTKRLKLLIILHSGVGIAPYLRVVFAMAPPCGQSRTCRAYHLTVGEFERLGWRALDAKLPRPLGAACEQVLHRTLREEAKEGPQ